MSIVILQLPAVKYCQEARPRRCPYCTGETFQRWGGNAKRVKDPHLGEVWAIGIAAAGVGGRFDTTRKG